MKKTLLRGENVTKKFLGTNSDPVLDRINVEIYEGDYTIIMGPSGAGKSTLLYSLSCMDTITSGKIFYKDQEISAFKEAQMAKLRISEFGFVFQQMHLVSNLTLFENVAVAGYLNKEITEQDRKERENELLTQMNVEQVKDRISAKTSGGEGQRAAIARAMINNPGIIFADEPTGSLNKRNSTEVLDLFTQINENGQSILMVTHDVRAAIRGTRILYLEDGKILDELSLPPFALSNIMGREEQVTAWLTSLAW